MIKFGSSEDSRVQVNLLNNSNRELREMYLVTLPRSSGERI